MTADCCIMWKDSQTDCKKLSDLKVSFQSGTDDH